jgi:hypothetical protein
MATWFETHGFAVLLTMRGEVITRLNDRNNTQVPERVRFELNHDRALSFCFDAFSSREPMSTSLENALNDRNNTQSLEYM